jgi:hypothetical protein
MPKRPLYRAKLSALVILLALSVLFSLPAQAASLVGEPTPIAPGTSYRQTYRPEGPWVINVVEAQLSEKYLEPHSLLGQGGTVGRRGVSSMLSSRASDKLVPVAAVNGDYFAMAGGAYTTIPLGFQAEAGELVTFPDPGRSAFYLLADGSPHVGRMRANAWLTGFGDLLFPLAGLNRPPEHGELVLFTPRFGKETRGPDSVTQLVLSNLSGPIKSKCEISATIESIAVRVSRPIPAGGAVLVANGVASYALRHLKAGDQVGLRITMDPDVGEIRMAVGGGPRLVRDGQISVESKAERFSDLFASRRHPRTGAGLRGDTLVMVTVDGRQPGYSDGMTLREFAQLFIDLGCKEALNLDGGGSTTMVVRNRIVNSPSDGAERKVANALALFSTAPVTGQPVRLAVEPAEADVLSGEKLQLVARGLDEYYNPILLDQKAVRWDTASLGRMDGQGNFVADLVTAPTAGLVTARCRGMMAAAVICVVPAPTRLTITPGRVTIAPRATQQFTVRAYDQDNRPVRFAPNRVAWEVEPASSGARIDGTGKLRAPSTEAELTITARIGDVPARAVALVGAVTTVLADFERPGDWSFASTPKGLPGGVSLVADPLKKGNHCLQLKYDFSKHTGTRTAEATLGLPLGETRTISVRVLGDGQGGWLRARLRDAADRTVVVDLAPRVDWAGQWHRLTAWLPDDVTPPFTLESIYLTEYHVDRGQAGDIYIDDIGAESLPNRNGRPAQAVVGEAVSGAGLPAGPVQGVSPEREKASSLKGNREGAEMSELPTYLCRRTTEPITIDGKLDEPIWSRALPVGDFRLNDGSGEPQLPTEVKLCWDDQYLYLAFVAIDTDIWGTMLKRDDPIYEEEVVEAFLSTGGDVAGPLCRYFEFEWSPHNVAFDAKIAIPEHGGRDRMIVNTDWHCQGCKSAVQVVGTLDKRDDIDQQWTVEAALPFAEIGREGKPPADGERWRANFYRIDRAASGEFSCWSPTLQSDFHIPARFGHLVFSKQYC